MSASRRLAALAVALACLCAAARADGPNVFLFDMGAEDSPVWEGFQPVTPKTTYDAQRGYGWTNPPADLTAWVNEGVDALAVDCVTGIKRLAATFRVDVPDGDYTVWVLTGAMGNYWRLRYLIAPHRLSLQGKVVEEIKPPPTDLFRCANYDWRSDHDVYDQFIASRFRWLRHDARVDDEHLRITFAESHDFPVCAVVVAEASVAQRVAEKLAQIEARRRDAFNSLWRETRPPPDPPASVSTEERQRGYILATAYCSDDMRPWSQPAADSNRERIDLFATPGKQEQASFAVFALRDLEDVSFRVSDLRSADGKALPASALRPGLVQFLPWSTGHQEYALRECLILPLRPTFVGGGTCKRFWLTLPAPEDAAAGVYEGRIEVTATNAPPAALALRVRVAPVRLQTPPVERFMYFGTMFYLARAYLIPPDEEKLWESMRAEVRFMKDNQFCRAECIIGPHGEYLKVQDGKVVDVDVSATDRLMKMLREENAWPRDGAMTCRACLLVPKLGGHFYSKAKPTVQFIPTPEGQERFVQTIKIVQDKAVKAGWPEVAFEVLGEFSNYGKAGAEFAVQAHTLLKQAGVHNTIRGNGPCDMEAVHKGLVDYPQPNWAMMKKEWFDFMKKNGKRLWAYNFARSRFSMGWFCFKHGITRASYESGVYANGQPGNRFDTDSEFPMGLPTSMVTIEPTVWLKRLVQGAVDYEYLYNLDQRIREAEKSPGAEARKAAAEARAWLDAKLAQLPDGVDYVRGDPKVDQDVQGRFWPVHDLDKYRWQAAEHLMAMEKAMAGGAK